jgi:solute carrier family 35 protein
MLVNKQVVKVYRSPVTILDMQLAFTVLVLATVFAWTLHFGSKRDVWRWVSVVPLLYAGMLTTSMIAQLYASVGLQVVIRNLGPLVTLPIERVFNEPIVADAYTWASLIFILVGIVLYMHQSLMSQQGHELAAGVVLMLLNLVVAMFERLYQRKLIAVEPVDVSKTGMLLLNNLGAILPVSLLLAVPGLNEAEAWRTNWPKATVIDYMLLVVSGICGIAIGWTAINAQQYVTATTMLVITNLNKIVVVAIGIIFMGDPHSPVALLGIGMALGGGVWYALARQNVANRAKEAKERAAALAAATATETPAASKA